MPYTLFDLTGKTALVTGAASGLGFAIAEVLAQNGARIVLIDLNRDQLTQVVSGFTGRGFEAYAEALDVTEKGAIAEAVLRILERFGALDIAFANAGISGGPGPFTDEGEIGAVSHELWGRVIDTNLIAVFETIQAAAKPMIQQRSGRIVVTASTAGFRADPMLGYAYTATKAAVVNLVKQAAIDLARYNVLVNGIAPGPFRTNIAGGRLLNPATEKQFADLLPLGRIGRPEEIKGAALLLASEASSFMAGAIIPVDGGTLAW